MVPQTVEGRSFLLVFMLFGIPFFAMLTKSISSEINFHVLQRKKEREHFAANINVFLTPSHARPFGPKHL